MRAVQLERWGRAGLVLKEIACPRPGPGEVLIRVRAASLNYRDLEIVKGRYAMPVSLPIVPASDAVGQVVELGVGVTRFAIGDRVSTVFFPDWHDGPFRKEYFQRQLGSSVRGVLQEFITAPERELVHAPRELCAEAATLPIAAVTAWNVLRDADLRAGETVLVIGTGGVSLFALQLAQAHGAHTIAVTRDARKIPKLRALGANLVLDSSKEPQWGQRVAQLTDGRGVDIVVEVGGSQTLRQSSEALKVGGYIGIVGYLSGSEVSIDLRTLFIGKRATLQGHTVGSRASFEEMNRAIDLHRLTPVIDSTFPLEKIAAAFDRTASGEIFGKVLITL